MGAAESLNLLRISGAGDVTRTRDLLITNQLLYQLSYAGPGEEEPGPPARGSERGATKGW